MSVLSLLENSYRHSFKVKELNRVKFDDEEGVLTSIKYANFESDRIVPVGRLIVPSVDRMKYNLKVVGSTGVIGNDIKCTIDSEDVMLSVNAFISIIDSTVPECDLILLKDNYSHESVESYSNRDTMFVLATKEAFKKQGVTEFFPLYTTEQFVKDVIANRRYSIFVVYNIKSADGEDIVDRITAYVISPVVGLFYLNIFDDSKVKSAATYAVYRFKPMAFIWCGILQNELRAVEQLADTKFSNLNDELLSIKDSVKVNESNYTTINERLRDYSNLSDQLVIFKNKLNEFESNLATGKAENVRLSHKVSELVDLVQNVNSNLTSLTTKIEQMSVSSKIASLSDRVHDLEVSLPINVYNSSTVFETTSNQISESIKSSKQESKRYSDRINNKIGVEVEHIRSELQSLESTLQDINYSVLKLQEDFKVMNDKELNDRSVIYELKKSRDEIEQDLSSRVKKIQTLDNEIGSVHARILELNNKLNNVPTTEEVIGGLDNFVDKLSSTGKLINKQGYFNVPSLGEFDNNSIIVSNEGYVICNGLSKKSVVSVQPPESFVKNYTITIDFSKLPTAKYRVVLTTSRVNDQLPQSAKVISIFDTILDSKIVYLELEPTFNEVMSGILYITDGRFVYV